MIEAIVLSIILHAQAVMPILGSTRGSSGAAPATTTQVLVLTAADGVVVLQPDQVIVLQ